MREEGENDHRSAIAKASRRLRVAEGHRERETGKGEERGEKIYWPRELPRLGAWYLFKIQILIPPSFLNSTLAQNQLLKFSNRPKKFTEQPLQF